MAPPVSGNSAGPAPGEAVGVGRGGGSMMPPPTAGAGAPTLGAAAAPGNTGGFLPPGLAGAGRGGGDDQHKNAYSIMQALNPDLEPSFCDDAEVIDPRTGLTVAPTTIGVEPEEC